MRSVTVCDQDDLGTCGGECYRCRLEALQKRLDELVEAVGEMRHAQIDYWNGSARKKVPRTEVLCIKRRDELFSLPGIREGGQVQTC